MEKLSAWIVKHRIKLLVFFLLALVVSAVTSRLVVTNYEMSEYLPEEMGSVKALALTEKHFGLPSNVRVMVPTESLQAAKALKDQIAAVPGVDQVLWLDDVVSLYTPVSMMPTGILERYYQNEQALLYVYFEENDFAQDTGKALEAIRAIVGPESAIYGSASSSQEVIKASSSQLGTMGTILVPVILIILLLATTSWIEPFLFLATLLAAIALNNGTNFLLGEVSFITRGMATALQLAISMDYAIFLLHRFSEEREMGHGVEDAMKHALTKSFGAITASSVTTIVGFLALLLMQFKIGTDMGLVFAKGITFSLLTTLFLLPALTILCDKWIIKTHHRSFIPSMKGLGKLVYKLRHVTVVAVLLLIVPAFLGQQANSYIYGGSTISDEVGSPSYQARVAIESEFGPYNPTILLVPKGNPGKELSMVNDLEDLTAVKQIQSLSTLVDPKIPTAMLPASATKAFDSGGYHRLIVVLNTPEESDATFEAIDQVKDIGQRYYPGTYAYAGASVGLSDIKTVASNDNLKVSLVAILAVAAIILLTFKSLSLPILLVLPIETAVFLNMSVPYFSGYALTFVGMLVVSSLQLGSTIDYAILLTGRYLERRTELAPKESAILAIDDAGGSILTSGAVLTLAGFIIAKTSAVETVSEMGILIGRGTLLSVIMVFAFLPALLVIFDGLIQRTTATPKSDQKARH